MSESKPSKKILIVSQYFWPEDFRVNELAKGLINEGYNPTYGARPLRRAVMRLLEDSLAEEVLSEKIKAGDTAVVDVSEDNQVRVLLGEKFEVLQDS